MPSVRLAVVSAVALPVALTGCVASLPAAAPVAVSASEMRPDVFFAGHTRGLGRLALAFGGTPDTVRVESRGQREAGAFRLDQAITHEGRTRERTWRMHIDGATGLRASLSDAHGPVVGILDGPVLRLRYRATAWGAVMRQTLTLLPGDTAVDNRATVRFLGLPVARLHERIVRVP